jgi:HSP20 family protein
MTLVRWAPFRELGNLQREMNQLFDTLTPTNDGLNSGLNNGLAFMPAAEIQETPEIIQLRIEVPGLEAKDLDVQVTAEAVSISGERKSETKTEEKGVTRSEFRYGKFRRVIPLPSRIHNDKVEAEYKDGILNLVLPKVEAEKNKIVKLNLG